jgi:cellulose synthase/poly-beta-1,6-N-acetylglucosamine synthase-like glycosyltransferase
MPSQGAPLVSVVIPAYNAERFLGRAMRSALAQTYPLLELIVVDDGSTDGTAGVIRSFRDRRVRHLFGPNRGQGAARNQGIRASAGRYVTFLDADDVYLPDKVRRQVDFLETHQDCRVVFCYALHFYSRRPCRLLARRAASGSGDIFRDLLRASLINPNTMMVAGDILRGGFLFREDRYYPEEWDLCLRLARAGYRFGRQDEPLVVVEIRDDSNTAMAIQWTLKGHTLEMFERLFSQMTEQERAAYGADEVLRSCRTRLAVSALVSPDPARVFASAAGALPPLLATIVERVLKIVPSAVVRSSAGAVWRLRQRLSLARVRDPAAEQAWAQIRASSE